jgi:hypothetical protein
MLPPNPNHCHVITHHQCRTIRWLFHTATKVAYNVDEGVWVKSIRVLFDRYFSIENRVHPFKLVLASVMEDVHSIFTVQHRVP